MVEPLLRYKSMAPLLSEDDLEGMVFNTPVPFFDTADENGWELDELIHEKRGSTYWIHFAVRPKENRRKILFDCR